jgi:hypothetical protein
MGTNALSPARITLDMTRRSLGRWAGCPEQFREDDSTPNPRVRRARATFDWIFRCRKTGKVTIAQFPNLSLGVFLVASLVGRVVHLTDTSRTLLDVVVGLSLAWWAVDEIIRGANPWRRFLGATVFTLLIVGHVPR